MSAQYTKTQPAGFRNDVKNIAIVGIGGHSGSYIAQALLKTGQHKITALMRAESESKVPEGITRKNIDYSNYSTLVEALKGQQALIITMSVTAPKEQEKLLIKAAAEANVDWVMPSHWGGDLSDKKLGEDSFVAPSILSNIDLIESSGKSSWVSVCCGFWYEWSLSAGTAAYGISWPKKEVVLYDDGNQKICTSTWPQVGRAVANLFSLPVLPHDENDKSVTLSQFRNKVVYVNSFTVSQRDMLASLCRVTGTSEKDFTVTENPLPDYYNKAVEDMKKGDRMGFAKALYSRSFFKDGCGDYSHKLDNGKLGLAQEDLDEYTKLTVDWIDQGKVTWFQT